MSQNYLSYNDSGNHVLLTISSSYSRIHGWLSLLICFVGIPFNLFIVLVLTKTKIASFAINLILICIALSDTITMLIYVPYCVHFYVFHSNAYSVEPSPERDTHFWITYSIVNIFVSITFHSFSVWLTVYLAIYRYFYIKNSFKQTNSKFDCSKCRLVKLLVEKPFVIVFLMMFFCVLYCLPTYFYPTIEKALYENYTVNELVEYSYVFYINQSELNRMSNGVIFKASFYAQALFAKTLPCILVTTFIALLIYHLVKIQRKKDELNIPQKEKKLENKSNTIKQSENESEHEESIIILKEYNFKQTDLYAIANKSRRRAFQENMRTNLMLLTVCVLFLITEFPQSLLIMFSVFDQEFHDNVYKPLGDLMDILVLVNNSINFVLYCTMSKAFRDAFKACFRLRQARNSNACQM